VENSILEFLLWYPGKFWKNNSVGVYDPVKKCYRKAKSKHIINGVSDILGVMNGRFIAIEVKSAKGRLSEAQKDFIHEVKQNGGIAFVARSLQDVKDNLEDEAKRFRSKAEQSSLAQAKDLSEM
tara:strand:- start:1369 stop:1740 length:372 start_codon:yes stop_codon:yes gene_type:complete